MTRRSHLSKKSLKTAAGSSHSTSRLAGKVLNGSTWTSRYGGPGLPADGTRAGIRVSGPLLRFNQVMNRQIKEKNYFNVNFVKFKLNFGKETVTVTLSATITENRNLPVTRQTTVTQPITTFAVLNNFFKLQQHFLFNMYCHWIQLYYNRRPDNLAL